MILINTEPELTLEDKRLFDVIRRVCEAKDKQRIRELSKLMSLVGGNYDR
jgi:hypothetical protein